MKVEPVEVVDADRALAGGPGERGDPVVELEDREPVRVADHRHHEARPARRPRRQVTRRRG